jgi:hypothetical protein
MNIELTEISESNFQELNLPILFEDKLIDRMFGVLSNGKNKYKIGWQSTDIKPTITIVINTLCSIGIDLTFVIFDFDKGEIHLKLFLDYYFYNTIMYNGFIYVITQLEIIKINISDLTVATTCALPDFFESIHFDKGSVIVRCVDNEIISIE